MLRLSMTKIAAPLMRGAHVHKVTFQPVCIRVASFSTNGTDIVEKGKENIKNTAQDAAETAQKKAADGAESMKETFNEASDTAQKKASEGKEAVKDTMKDISDTAQQKAYGVVDSMKEALHYVAGSSANVVDSAKQALTNNTEPKPPYSTKPSISEKVEEIKKAADEAQKKD